MDDPKSANSRPWTRIKRLARSLAKPAFRHAYMARQLKLFLAEQIRALRGELTQNQFGEKIGKPQSVVSRLEKQADRQISIQTLIDIAKRLDIAVIIRFVDYPTFLRYTEDYSDEALAPRSYDEQMVEALAQEGEWRAREQELLAVFDGPPTSSILVERKDDKTTKADTETPFRVKSNQSSLSYAMH